MTMWYDLMLNSDGIERRYSTAYGKNQKFFFKYLTASFLPDTLTALLYEMTCDCKKKRKTYYYSTCLKNRNLSYQW